MAKTKEIEKIALALIEPDENQPRKNFNAAKLAFLMKSIERYGIKSPLTIQKTTTGKYILVDGERRYRAAKELGLKEVPAVIEEPMSDTDRLVLQFHVQEQHEGWSPLEKAIAVANLSESLGVPVMALAEMLSIPHQTISAYTSFSKLIERNTFQKYEVPIDFASEIIKLRRFVKRSYRDILKQDFDKERERSLELAIISRAKKGEIQTAGDILRITDIIRSNPKLIEKFIDDEKLTIDKMYIAGDGEIMRNFRHIKFNSFTTTGLLKKALKLKTYEYLRDDKEAVNRIKDLYDTAKELLAKIG